MSRAIKAAVSTPHATRSSNRVGIIHLGYRRAVLASVWGRDGFRACARSAVSGACAAPGRDLRADYSSAIYSARYFLSSQSALGTREQTERSVVLVLVIPHGMIWHCFPTDITERR